MNSLSFLNHHHSHIGSCHNSVRYVMPEPPMAHPGGNENNSNPPQVGLGVAPMVTRGAPCISSAVDDIESPKSRLEAAINKEWSISVREAVVVQQAAEVAAAAEQLEDE
ncbi:hypothetical protein M0R45_016968 [Rubus argutus]|uniref:Uncharacterized protein n=1 Tax=Rubus argutus TaxID=59490 RepID=A0AAW1XW18_RUBAR